VAGSFQRWKAKKAQLALVDVQGNAMILPTGGKGRNKVYPNIVARLTEDPPEHFHEVAVSRDARGNYYCSFVYDEAEQHEDDTRKTHAMRTDGIVAFDLGIKTLTTGYADQGCFYHIGGFKGYRYYNKQLDEIRSKRKIGNRLVYNDWGLYGFVQMLAYKCLRYGKDLVIISERDTTKTCRVCKCKKDMPLWQRTYRCANCGLVMDRDENSAVNIYQRFLAGPPPHTRL
jgi:transposase